MLFAQFKEWENSIDHNHVAIVAADGASEKSYRDSDPHRILLSFVNEEPFFSILSS